MTNLIPTANIAFIFGKEATKKLTTKGATFSNLVDELEKTGEGFVFKTEGNPNFLSLEHSVNIGKSFELTLSLLDPTGEFEKRFLTSNVLEILANSFPEDKSRFFSGSWTGNKNQKDLRGIRDNFLQNRDLEQFKDIDKEYLYNNKKRNIYILYGVGNELSLWAGPFKVYLQSIDIKIEGARILTLKFVATENHLDPKENTNAYGTPVAIDNMGIDTVCEGRSAVITFRNLNRIYNPYKLPLNPPIDIHAIVVRTLRDYIRNACGHKNIIILLPNLNNLAIKAIMYSRNISRTDRNSTQSLGSLLGGVSMAAAGAITPEIEPYAKAELYIRTILNEFGIDFTAVDPATDQVLPLAIHPQAASQISNTTSRRNLSAESPSRSSQIVQQGNNLTALQNYKDYFLKSLFFAKILNRTSASVPKHMDYLDTFIGNINEILAGEYHIAYEVLPENNARILDLWKNDDDLNCQNYPLFSDDLSFEEGEEFVIFGDMSLIREFLYASGDKTLSNYLYPLDAEILCNQMYEQKMKEITSFNKNVHIKYPYGSDYFIPDEFAYFFDDPTTSGIKESFGSLFNTSNLDSLKNLNCPVFRYNTNNPNVSEFNIRQSEQYYALLLTHFENVVRRRASGVIEGIIPSEYITLKPKKILDLIFFANDAGIFNGGISDSRRLEILDEIKKLIDSSDFNGQDKSEVMLAVVSMITYLSKDCNIGLRRLFKQQYASDPSLILHSFLNQLYNQAFQVNIKTLPMFNISNLINITRPCIFLMQNPQMPMIKQSNPSLLSIIYSGLYRIMGFRHVINSDSCYSEFFLQKFVYSSPIKTEQKQNDIEDSATTNSFDASAITSMDNPITGNTPYVQPPRQQSSNSRVNNSVSPSFHPYFFKPYNIK